MDKDIIELLKILPKNISDKHGCMTKLAEAQIPLMECIARTGYNNGGNDANGAYSSYKIIKEQLERLDKMILALK